MVYRVHRMRETTREQFRWAAHSGGSAIVKPKDYEVRGEVEAATPYAAWKILGAQGSPLQTGDILEEISPEGAPGALHIAKYVGFENAAWFVADAKPENPPVFSPKAAV